MNYSISPYPPPNSLYAAYNNGVAPNNGTPVMGVPTIGTPNHNGWALPQGISPTPQPMGNFSGQVFQPLTQTQLANWQPQFVTANAGTGTGVGNTSAGVAPLIGSQPIVTADPNATANTKYLAESGGQVKSLTSGEIVKAGWGVKADGSIDPGTEETQVKYLANYHNAVAPLTVEMQQYVDKLATEVAAKDYPGIDPQKVKNVLTGNGPIDLATMIKMQEVKGKKAAAKYGIDTSNPSGRPRNGDEFNSGRDYNGDKKVDEKDKEWYDKDQAALKAWDATWDYNKDGTVGDEKDRAEFDRRKTGSTNNPTDNPPPPPPPET